MKRQTAMMAAVLVMAALFLLALAPVLSEVTNFSGIHLEGSFTTATPAFMVDQTGAGVVTEFRDGATPVARIPNGGGLDIVVGDLEFGNGETVNNTTDGFIGYTGGQLWSTTTVTATDGQTITPTVYTLYNIDSASAITVTFAACTEGGPLIVAGNDANDVTIADTNIRTSDGNAAVVGQYDVWVAICVDAEWIEIANIANQ